MRSTSGRRCEQGVGGCGRVCGCEVDVAMKVKDEDQVLMVKALNEIVLRAQA